jgi:hypothetical protein
LAVVGWLSIETRSMNWESHGVLNEWMEMKRRRLLRLRRPQRQISGSAENQSKGALEVKRMRPRLSRRGSRILISGNMEHPPAESNEKCLKDKYIFASASHFNDETGNHGLNRSNRAFRRLPTRGLATR